MGAARPLYRLGHVPGRGCTPTLPLTRSLAVAWPMTNYAMLDYIVTKKDMWVVIHSHEYVDLWPLINAFAIDRQYAER